jgi:hypothetical protein
LVLALLCTSAAHAEVCDGFTLTTGDFGARPPPEDAWADCESNCPILVRDDITYFALADNENEIKVIIVGYDKANKQVFRVARPGVRYVKSMSFVCSAHALKLVGTTGQITIGLDLFGPAATQPTTTPTPPKPTTPTPTTPPPTPMTIESVSSPDCTVKSRDLLESCAPDAVITIKTKDMPADIQRSIGAVQTKVDATTLKLATRETPGSTTVVHFTSRTAPTTASFTIKYASPPRVDKVTHPVCKYGNGMESHLVNEITTAPKPTTRNRSCSRATSSAIRRRPSSPSPAATARPSRRPK